MSQIKQEWGRAGWAHFPRGVEWILSEFAQLPHLVSFKAALFAHTDQDSSLLRVSQMNQAFNFFENIKDNSLLFLEHI